MRARTSKLWWRTKARYLGVSSWVKEPFATGFIEEIQAHRETARCSDNVSLRVRLSWIQIQTQSSSWSLILGKCFNLSESQFLHLLNEGTNLYPFDCVCVCVCLCVYVCVYFKLDNSYRHCHLQKCLQQAFALECVGKWQNWGRGNWNRGK